MVKPLMQHISKWRILQMVICFIRINNSYTLYDWLEWKSATEYMNTCNVNKLYIYNIVTVYLSFSELQVVLIYKFSFCGQSLAV